MKLQRFLATLGVFALLVSACGLGPPTGEDDGGDVGLEDPGDCVPVEVAVSSEKIDLISDLARAFNGSDDAEVDGRCVFVRPYSKASGAAMALLADGWPDEEREGRRPVVWSPASSSWGVILNQLRADEGQPPMAPESAPFMLTPLVIAMPRPMAEALGWPDTPIGYADILALSRDPEGWGSLGHPEWGPFRLGKTNPNYSTSGLSALIAQYYAATGKVRDLTTEDLARPEVVAFSEGVESAVVHYGDTTLTFLNNLARNDARGTALTYASAVAVEEVSIVNYNRGNPDGVLEPGEQLVPPRVPLVAVYPTEGTLFSDNPFIILDAEWVSDEQRAAAERFEEYVMRPENQARVLEFGFRPGNPEVPLGEPLTAELGVDPQQPQTTLAVPDPPVLVELLRRWEEQRKDARVLLAIDVSGSMGDAAGATEDGRPLTKLDLAVAAAGDALEQFKDTDEVGLRVFSTGLGPNQDRDYLDLVPIAPIGQQRDELRRRIESLTPVAGTPLYTATQASYEDLLASYDPEKINAVVVLSDGRNEDPRNEDLEGLLAALSAGGEGQQTRPVRIFPIAYGGDADLAVLRRIAEATDAAAYDSSDPTAINRVFDAVISNF
ncbi:MAG TPA: extracellular solute-binding protein [Egibacteraceae bacterium]|jgi:Ca-activated chloride channel homolog|nr:extracellular solute-binding protein [Egibacteraceae bacterium]